MAVIAWLSKVEDQPPLKCVWGVAAHILVVCNVWVSCLQTVTTPNNGECVISFFSLG